MSPVRVRLPAPKEDDRRAAETRPFLSLDEFALQGGEIRKPGLMGVPLQSSLFEDATQRQGRATLTAFWFIEPDPGLVIKTWRLSLTEIDTAIDHEPTASSMITHLTLSDFKGFHHAELDMSGFTLVVGTNASGKSNLRDAFRFIHGIGRGYTLAEIIGEKWIEGGVLQWRGILGGTREATFEKADNFSLEVTIAIHVDGKRRTAIYSISVEVPSDGRTVRVLRERLKVEGRGPYLLDARLSSPHGSQLHVRLKRPRPMLVT